MHDANTRQILITRGDLSRCSALVNIRFSDPEAESIRTQLIHAVLSAEADAERAMRSKSRYTLVNHYGTLGTHDILEATEVLFEALSQYASAVRRVAAYFRQHDLDAPALVQHEAV